MADFEACAGAASMKRGRAEAIVGEVQAAVRRWPEFATQAGLGEASIEKIGASHRLSFR